MALIAGSALLLNFWLFDHLSVSGEALPHEGAMKLSEFGYRTIVT